MVSATTAKSNGSRMNTRQSKARARMAEVTKDAERRLGSLERALAQIEKAFVAGASMRPHG